MCLVETAPAPERYQVYLLNDSFNMREYVLRALMMVAELSEEDASDVMMQANWGGGALVGEWEKPVAEHTYAGLLKANLRASIKRVEPDGGGADDMEEDEGDDDDDVAEVRRIFPGGGIF